MKQRHMLPGDCMKCLEDYHVKKEDICYTAQYDVAEDYSFTKGYLVLTKTKLVLIRYPQKMADGAEFRFGGYAANWDGAQKEAWVLSVYEQKDVEKLSVEREITGGVLVGRIKGEEHTSELQSHQLSRMPSSA